MLINYDSILLQETLIPKVLKSTCSKLWCLSACKKSISPLSSFLRYFKDIAILVLFQYIANVVLLTCSCHRLYSTKYSWPFFFRICILVCHAFILTVSFSVWLNPDNNWFLMAAPLHTSYSLTLWFLAYCSSFFETLFRQGNKLGPSDSLGLMCLHALKALYISPYSFHNTVIHIIND